MGLNRLFDKVHRKLLNMRLKPIRVFCFHQVSDEFEPETMKKGDWMQTEVFKQNIIDLKKNYSFISLSEVSFHIRHDVFRVKRYAALTADDGWASLKNIMPWLAEQNIPVTLFVNPYYLDGKHYRERDTEKYLTMEELGYFVTHYKNVSVASHGWEHKKVSSFSGLEFREDVEKSSQILRSLSGYIPFYAYPWGRHTPLNDSILCEYGLIPVLMDSVKNYTDPNVVHRELLAG